MHDFIENAKVIKLLDALDFKNFVHSLHFPCAKPPLTLHNFAFEN